MNQRAKEKVKNALQRTPADGPSSLTTPLTPHIPIRNLSLLCPRILQNSKEKLYIHRKSSQGKQRPNEDLKIILSFVTLCQDTISKSSCLFLDANSDVIF